MANLSKNDVVNRLAADNGLSKYRARKLVDGLIDIINDEVAAGGEVRVGGLGIFSSTPVPGHEQYVPYDGSTRRVDDSRRLRIRPSGRLRRSGRGER